MSPKTPNYVLSDLMAALSNDKVLFYDEVAMIREASKIDSTLTSRSKIANFIIESPKEEVFFKSGHTTLDHTLKSGTAYATAGTPIDVYLFGLEPDTWYVAFVKANNGMTMMKSFHVSDTKLEDPKIATRTTGDQLAQALLKSGVKKDE